MYTVFGGLRGASPDSLKLPLLEETSRLRALADPRFAVLGVIRKVGDGG